MAIQDESRRSGDPGPRGDLQAVLYRIAETASAARDLPEFYAEIHAIVAELTYAENLFIVLYDEERQLLNWAYYVDQVDTDIPDPNMWEPIGTGESRGLTAYVLRTGVPQHISNERWLALIDSGEVDEVGQRGVDWLGIPLRADDRTIGVMVVQTYEPGQLYSDRDVALLAFVGQHIATALSRARAIEETRQRNAELALVNEIGQALARQLDFGSIVELVGEHVRMVFEARSVSIGLYDEATEVVRFVYEVDEGERMHSEPLPIGTGLTSIVITSRQPLRAGTTTELLSLGAIQIEGSVSESWLGVPIMAGERVIGMINLESTRQHAFDASDERLLSTLASSMGVALENARLFDETKRLLRETDERAAELAIVNSVQQGLAAQMDMQAMYDLVGDKVQEIFDAQVIDIGIVDREVGVIRFPYTIERGVRFPDEPMPVMGIRKHVLETRQPFVANEAAEERSAELGQPGVIQGEEPKSMVFAPLTVGETARGVISLQNLDREHAFSDSDVRLLMTLAGSLSVALENARLIDETRQRVAELGIVNRIGQALASQLDLAALIELVGEEMRTTFTADIAYLALHDHESNVIDFAYFHEGGERRAQASIDFGEGLTSGILVSREPMLINRAPDWETQGGSIVGTPVKSFLGVPILIGERAIGVLSVQSTTQEGRFGEADVRLLSTIAANVGVAIQNARLFLEARRRADEMAALAEVAREVSATLDLEAVLRQMTERAQALLEVDTSAVFLADESGERFRAIVAIGPVAEQIMADTISLGEGIIGDVAVRRTAEVVNDVLQDPRTVPIPGTDPDVEERLMVAPLVARDRLTGILAVWRSAPARPFTDADLAFLVGLSQQAAIAIENARLFEDADHRRALEERQRLARDLHDSVSQALFSMTLQARGAQLALEKEGIDPAGPLGRRLGDMRELTEGALAEMRMLIFELRPGALQEEGLVAAIRKLAHGIAARDALTVEVEAPEERVPLRPQAEEQLYRLAQEALTNVVKHARARRVRVSIAPMEQSAELVLEIADDGIAFDPSVSRPGHLGLHTMADRAESLGGRLDVLSRPGEGTTVRAVIPGEALRP